MSLLCNLQGWSVTLRPDTLSMFVFLESLTGCRDLNAICPKAAPGWWAIYPVLVHILHYVKIYYIPHYWQGVYSSALGVNHEVYPTLCRAGIGPHRDFPRLYSKWHLNQFTIKPKFGRFLVIYVLLFNTAGHVEHFTNNPSADTV